ncbi:heterodisulfide reductase-related iron-sulfur binding cluster [Rhodopila sp.]|uniref:heterodisulfide reductase-related iron-sulfur binding cluster n=1 Tax=Rhodopila sp. TaxID=2480087 RepID=UPI002CE6B545|nr:heterodisulfide reductase-related iron-sulfur binding cluster [Rhodopila sp.]HVZ10274.1 heterodisulfide reductase-related iron-sulfur binding cluster [Rhodopila sp.]
MREGSLEAPTRHPIPWQSREFYDTAAIEKELHRVFDICHGCRRCFNLCQSFPILFDLVDESPTQELDGVDPKDFKRVVDACTLCDMCFMTKCPYVPPHEFNLDFPHLMLRYRAMEADQGRLTFADKQLAETDRNGMVANMVSSLANWTTDRGNRTLGTVFRDAAGLHPEAELPKYAEHRLQTLAAAYVPSVNAEAPAFGRKAVIYATCFGNYNAPEVGIAARAVLARNGVETEVVYPACCGMPLLEQGRVADVAANARKVAAEMGPWIDKGYDVIALVPSCALMLKFEWPLIEPDDPTVARLAKASFDLSEYVVDIAKKEGIAPGMSDMPELMTLHMACHARAQNMGQKAAEMLRLVPKAKVKVIERCSGHGGSWGFKKEHFDIAMKIGRPVARQVAQAEKGFVTSECPLAGVHIAQGVDKAAPDASHPTLVTHPIQIIARAYGIDAVPGGRSL